MFNRAYQKDWNQGKPSFIEKEENLKTTSKTHFATWIDLNFSTYSVKMLKSCTGFVQTNHGDAWMDLY